MRDYFCDKFEGVYKAIQDGDKEIICLNADSQDFLSLSYTLTWKSHYSVIVDDYVHEIRDKASLLEALFYQVKLITMFSLNWDAFEEALNDRVKNLGQFKSLCLIFKTKNMRKLMRSEFLVVEDIIHDINIEIPDHKVYLILNE